VDAAAGGGFVLRTTREQLAAAQVVLATGGLSLPKTGSDGHGLRMAEGLGHSLVPTTPALVPLALAGSFHVPLPPERVVAVLRQACRSLGEAHAADLLRRVVGSLVPVDDEPGAHTVGQGGDPRGSTPRAREVEVGPEGREHVVRRRGVGELWLMNETSAAVPAPTTTYPLLVTPMRV